MHRVGAVLMIVVGLAFSACSREDRRDEPAARRVGRDAERASEEIKAGAKKAGKALQKAGKELRQGWNEEKYDSSRPRK